MPIGLSGPARFDGRANPTLISIIMYYFYTLQSQINDKLYKGTTNDLKKRVKEHNSGKVKSTKPYRPWKLIYYEAHRNKTLARKTEIFYKTGQGRRQLKKKLGLE
jgi:putative endonuclease